MGKNMAVVDKRSSEIKILDTYYHSTGSDYIVISINLRSGNKYNILIPLLGEVTVTIPIFLVLLGTNIDIT